MSELRFREGNVVLYVRERSTKYQARLKMENDKWKRISTGESNLKEASLIACEKYVPFFIRFSIFGFFDVVAGWKNLSALNESIVSKMIFGFIK